MTESHSIPPPASVVVAIAQLAPTSDRAANLARIGEMTTDAAARGADVIVFPEYASYFVSPLDASLAANAEALRAADPGPFATALTALAAAHRIVIVAGMLESAGDSRKARNTAIAVSGAGLLASARKLHLYDAFGQRESEWVEPGEIAAPETFEVGGIRFGLQTCYDLRFPEVSRRLADAGAHVALVPAEWVRGPLKEHHWLTLIAARAIENTMYVAAADHPPPVGVGHSVIVDPEGVAIATIGTASDVALARLRLAELERVRRVNPALELRRFSVAERGSAVPAALPNASSPTDSALSAST